jgi:flagellar biosynthesis/type III secretory pathway protein FliH
MQAMLTRSGVLLEAPGLWEGLTAKDRARVLALLARGYRRGHDAGYQAGWQKGHRAAQRMQTKAEAA